MKKPMSDGEALSIDSDDADPLPGRISERQRPQISVLIRETVAAGLLKPKDPDNRSTKFAEYLPAWA